MKGTERIKNLANNNIPQKLVDYLLQRDDMEEKYLNEEKNLNQMMEFIKSLAKKQAINGSAMIEDEVVYGWAIHYWDESNENLKLEKAKNTPDIKSEQKNIPPSKPKVQKDKDWKAEGQLALF